ncbi:MAG TPA: tetratricopeptide repeat protein [Bacteroidia bacterium]|nr:tetratricopeptide repeat protein [Bacteroidia bacterium]
MITRKLLPIVLFFLHLVAFSQKTAIYSHQDAGFKTALELFQKQKYGSAQKQFLKIINQYNAQPNNLVHIDAEYYSSICALELFNKDAELLLKKFVNDHPESARVQSAYFQLGKYNYRKKQYNKAIEWFAKVDIYDLNNEELSEFYFKRGYSYFENDSIENAKKDFFEIKDIDNKYAAPATYYFAHISYTQKNYQTALQHFNKLKANESFGSVSVYYIAQIFYLQGKYDSAIVFASPLLDTATKRVKELTKIVGESYYRTGRYKECIPYFERYKNFVGLARPEWYELGIAYYKTSTYNSAIPCFQNAADGNDSLAQNAYYHLGDCFLKPSPYVGGNNAKIEAKNAFDKAYKLDFDKQITEDAQFNYARLCYDLAFSPFNEAVTALNDYIAKYPQSPRIDECYKYLVNVFLSTKNYKEAMKSIESMKLVNEEMRMAYQKLAFLYGLQLHSNSQFQDAIMYLNRSLRYQQNRNYTALANYWKGEGYYILADREGITFGYDSAMVCYKNFLNYPGAINYPEYYPAHYNLGYVYFKKQDYVQANIWFRKYLTLKATEPREKLNDAYLRVGDGFFMTKDYANAVDYYDQALKMGNRDMDYALYQKGMAQGVTGKKDDKATTLNDLLKTYAAKKVGNKAGKYEAAAKYELANTYLQLGNESSALLYYKKVVAEHPESSYNGRALLQCGLIQSKNKDYDGALVALDKVLASYPKTTEAFEAINAMKDIYRSKGDMDSYEAKLKNIPYASVSSASLDTANYNVAFDYYDKGDCDNAIKNFTKYVQKYPDGIFLTDAVYYKADCDFKNKNYDAALNGYNYVIEKSHTQFTELSLLRASWINYNNKNYQVALPQYTRLAETAEYPANSNEGRMGEMRCNQELKNYEAAAESAKKVLILEKISNEVKAEAHVIIGKAAIEKASYDEAITEFSSVPALTRSEKSAEALYHIAYVLYLKSQYKDSQKKIFELINHDPSYDYWMGKGFILLSDNYVGQNDLFNAKFALEKLIEKSKSEELLTIAKEKLNKINETDNAVKMEEERKREKNKEIQIQFPATNPKDSLLYKTEQQ